MGKVKQYNPSKYKDRYELKERQSWIDHDNELMQMSADERYEKEYLTEPIDLKEDSEFVWV